MGAVVLLAAGLAIRLYGMADRGFWWDEIALWRAALSGHYGPHEAPLPAWISLLFMAAMRSVDSFTFHLPIILVGSLAIPGCLLLGRALGGNRVGLLSAALAAFSPMAIYYSQEGRAYGLLQLTSVLLLYAFVRSHQTNNSRWWSLYCVCVALGCATHPVTVQTLAALGLAYSLLFWADRLAGRAGAVDFSRLATLAGTTALGAAVGLSWLLFRTRLMSVFDEVYYFGLLTYLRATLTALGPGLLEPEPEALRLADLIGAGIFILFALGMHRLREQRGLSLVFGLTFVLPLVIVYSTLGFRAHWLWFRYIVHLLLPYLAVVALGVERCAARLSRPLGWAFSVLVLAAFAPGLAEWASQAPEHRSEPYPSWAREIDRMGPELIGVIVPVIDYGYGDESSRMLNLYQLYRTDDLPCYLLNPPELRLIRLEDARFGLARLPVPGTRVAQLPRGSYAFLDRAHPPRCDLLARQLGEEFRVTQRSSEAGFLICVVR